MTIIKNKLLVNPGHGGSDPGANGYGIFEKDWNLMISLYQYERLKELGADVEITRTTDVTTPSRQLGKQVRDSKAEYCMSNHFNASSGKGRGVETIHSLYGGKKEATRLAKAIVDESKLPLRRVFTRNHPNGGDYYFMHRTTGDTRTIIVEYGFIDNKKDNDFYKNTENFIRVAERVVKEWCSILGVKYTTPQQNAVTGKEETLYRVVTGSFSEFKNAQERVENLKFNGYDSFIDEVKQ